MEIPLSWSKIGDSIHATVDLHRVNDVIGGTGLAAVRGLRTLVSADKHRLKDDKFDLDMTYITDRIISMGFPASSVLHQAYRNNINEVREYLEKRHGETHYMVYNLTENPYDSNYFNGNVKHFGFPDHHAPPLQLLWDLCEDIDKYLLSDPLNVVVIHCKAGKGRTGTSIASYLLYSHYSPSPSSALHLFASKRSSSLKGVTVPSQILYVHYLSDLVNNKLPITPTLKTPPTYYVSKIKFGPLPSTWIMTWNIVIEAVIVKNWETAIWQEVQVDQDYSGQMVEMKADGGAALEGDIYIRGYRRGVSGGLGLLWRFGFHTSWLEEQNSSGTDEQKGSPSSGRELKLIRKKKDLDSPSHGRLKDKRFGDEFTVEVYFTKKKVRGSSSATKGKEKEQVVGREWACGVCGKMQDGGEAKECSACGAGKGMEAKELVDNWDKNDSKLDESLLNAKNNILHSGSGRHNSSGYTDSEDNDDTDSDEVNEFNELRMTEEEKIKEKELKLKLLEEQISSEKQETKKIERLINKSESKKFNEKDIVDEYEEDPDRYKNLIDRLKQGSGVGGGVEPLKPDDRWPVIPFTLHSPLEPIRVVVEKKKPVRVSSPKSGAGSSTSSDGAPGSPGLGSPLLLSGKYPY